MSDIAVLLSGVTKEYPLPGEPRSLAGRFISGKYGRPRVVKALSEIDLTVKRGETLAVLGPNGAGKSTLLSIIAGITRPTSGHLDTNGRIAAVLGVGAGFHPELTGIENLFLNATLHGLPFGEIRRRAGDIIEFAGIEEFIEAPLRAYSSGMLARLGFSIAVHLAFDILIVDETLSVGDNAFKERCSARLAEVRKKGKTVIFATHSDDEARKADRRIHLARGRISLSNRRLDPLSEDPAGPPPR